MIFLPFSCFLVSFILYYLWLISFLQHSLVPVHNLRRTWSKHHVPEFWILRCCISKHLRQRYKSSNHFGSNIFCTFNTSSSTTYVTNNISHIIFWGSYLTLITGSSTAPPFFIASLNAMEPAILNAISLSQLHGKNHHIQLPKS